MGEFSKTLLLGSPSLLFLFVVIIFLYASSFPSDLSPLGSWKQHLTDWTGGLGQNKTSQDLVVKDPMKYLLRRLVRGQDRIQLDFTGFSCHNDLHSEVCLTNKPIVINNSALTIYIPSDQQQLDHTVQPYARKEDGTAMKAVAPVKMIHRNTSLPACRFNHHVPAMVFSSGGFTGNLFHEFNEVIIPLFITCRHFRSELQFIITDFKPWWVEKYSRILSQLSRFEIINPAANASIHCFPGVVVGLKYHDNLALNYTKIPGGYSMFDFKDFLRTTYNLKIQNVSKIQKLSVVLISRPMSRRFLNEGKMVEMMEELGFQVDVIKPNRMSSLDKFSGVINSCNVMVGAHGAGLTNAVFLPDGAVFVQVVPLGLDWASETYFGGPAKEMGVKYMKYKIDPDESTLLDKYGPDHPVIVDPMSVFLKGYYAAREVYVDGQDMKINLTRFRETLLKAGKLLGRSTPLH
ncbi:Glycosyltransferase family 61 protein [Quillaja saponaria]|uniref:Glycosyltransferase family 61 protein n=1 Tax=Quillaja saponaria TaxID=32244 RepID=A0AAD7LMG7_QUISA|nr:Glycosyltransferase family 61 protein [Quillaja saponaria]